MSKGAIIVLIWNFFITSVSNYLIAFLAPLALEETTLALGLTLPVAGWLADIRFGRYKVICWSMWIMWIASMLVTISSVIEQFLPGHHNTFLHISLVITFILAIGFGGYQANAIQFGLDQLQDASTTEITAFIIWYVWTYFSNGALFQFTYICINNGYDNNTIFGQLAVCTSITVVICSSYFHGDSLVKEPVTQNPFTLIYKVIQYAIKNKCPQRRSAFTYCEDELPSRIDFGKSKYGGPFTTEQVEDVKTFLRLLIFIAVASVLAGQVVILLKVSDEMNNRFIRDTISIAECYMENLHVHIFSHSAIAVVMPLHEFVLYPAFQKCTPSSKIYQRFVLGVIVQMARVVTLIVCDIRASKDLEHHKNATISHDYEGLGHSPYRYLMAVESILELVSLAILCISSIEFLASQTPYSMRGLMIGVGYGSVFIFTVIEYGIYWPFTHKLSMWGTGIISIEVWYLFTVLLVLIVCSGLLLLIGRWYKNRKREDVLPNEHIFAERYYSQLH